MHPRNCVIRFCRFCKGPMRLNSYKFDSNYRWYNFHCERCDFVVEMGEVIAENIKNLHRISGCQPEPLTIEEIKLQNSPSDEAAWRLSSCVKESLTKQARSKKLREAHSLDDNNLEDLR